jgi:O-antigen ligase
VSLILAAPLTYLAIAGFITFLTVRYSLFHIFHNFLAFVIVLILYDQLLKFFLGDDSSWNLAIFNPNISSYLIALASSLVPEILIIGKYSISKNSINVLLFLLCISTGSLLGVFIFVLIQVASNWSLFSRFKIFSLLSILFLGFIEATHISNSLNARFEIWKITLRIIKANFWSGIGINNYLEYFSKNRSTEYILSKGEDTLVKDPHNLFLNLFVTHGAVIGLLVTLSLTGIWIAITFSKNIPALAKVVTLTFVMHEILNVTDLLSIVTGAIVIAFHITRTEEVKHS